MVPKRNLKKSEFDRFGILQHLLKKKKKNP